MVVETPPSHVDPGHVVLPFRKYTSQLDLQMYTLQSEGLYVFGSSVKDVQDWILSSKQRTRHEFLEG